MNARTFLILALAFSVLMGGTAPSPLQRADIQRDLNALTRRGFAGHMVESETIELIDRSSGEKRAKNLQEPSEAKIRSWAAERGIPILEVDPNGIDTNAYAGRYNPWTSVPLGNGIGVPLVVGDLNSNHQPDIYGRYIDTLLTDYQTRVYEIDSAGGVLACFQYVPRPGISRLLIDADGDSLREVVWSMIGVASGYEQPSYDSLPSYPSYAHDMYYLNSSSGFTGIYMGNLDCDGLTDFLYQGSEPDPNDTNLAIAKTFVAEFAPPLQTFVRVWSTQLGPGGGAAGFSVGDFDSDGKIEFVATRGLSGRVYVAENTGDNQYAVVWQDSTPFVNLYYHGSGDVDNDAKIEFFTGATMSNGNWVLMYEADSNNTYSAKLLFHLRSGGVFAEPIYTSVDIDGDGTLELAMLVGADLYIFKSTADNRFYLWYLKREDTADGVAFYDFNGDGRMDIIVSKFGVNSQGRGWTYAPILVASNLVGVELQSSLPETIALLRSYPNPFNAQTTIEYALTKRSRVTLRVYDIVGQVVSTLCTGEQEAGRHRVAWAATNVATGLYICRLEAEASSVSHKLLLIR
jgi:hypothetical protein